MKTQRKFVFNEVVARHRNGIGGDPFYVVSFQCPHEDDPRVMRQMIATVFDTKRTIAVLDLADPIGLPMRGDNFEDELRAACKRFDRRESASWKRRVERARIAPPPARPMAG